MDLLPLYMYSANTYIIHNIFLSHFLLGGWRTKAKKLEQDWSTQCSKIVLLLEDKSSDFCPRLTTADSEVETNTICAKIPAFKSHLSNSHWLLCLLYSKLSTWKTQIFWLSQSFLMNYLFSEKKSLVLHEFRICD